MARNSLGEAYPFLSLSVDSASISQPCSVSIAPSKIPYVGISPIRLKTIILLNAFLSPVYIEHIYNNWVIICSQFCVWQMYPCVEFIVQSPFALSPFTETSSLLWAHPRILFAC